MSPGWLLKYVASASQAFKNSSKSSGFTVNLLTKTIGPTSSSSCDENFTLSSISTSFVISFKVKSLYFNFLRHVNSTSNTFFYHGVRDFTGYWSHYSCNNQIRAKYLCCFPISTRDID